MDLIELVKLGKQIVGKKSFSNWNSATCDSKLLCRQGKILNGVVSDQDCNSIREGNQICKYLHNQLHTDG